MLQRRLIFQSLDTSWASLSVLALVIVAAVLVILLSKYERKLVPPSVGFGLLVLRLTVIAVIWLALQQPVLTWSVDRERTGRVVVALDLSESMTTTDKIATKAEKLRWAMGLGIIGNEQNKVRVLRWLADLEADREPSWLDDNEGANDQQRAVLTKGRQELLFGAFGEFERLTRAEIARRLISDQKNNWLRELEKSFLVELRVFGGKSISAELPSLSGTVKEPPAAVARDVTSLAAALESSSNDQQSPVKAFIVLTDGRETAGGNPVAVARRWHELRTGVFPVLIGSERRPKDVVLDSLDVPPSVYLNDKPIAKVILQAAGFEGRDLTVVLERVEGDAKEPDQQTKIEVEKKLVLVPKADSGLPPTVTLEFLLDATKLGRQQYIVRAELLDGETREDNNARPFTLVVVDDKAKVLLVEGEARWEFRFLNNAFGRDERVRLERVLFDQPYLGELAEPFFPRKLDLPPAATPIEKTSLAEVDLVILGDIASQQLTEPGLIQLEKYVAEIGGTLVFIAGKRHMPLQYRSPTLDKLLPLTNPRAANSLDPPSTPPLARGFHLRLTPDGERESFLQLAADAETNRSTWKSLAGHPWAMIGDVKAGATVWATADEGQPLPPEMEKSRALLVQQYYGLGQVIWLGFDSTWRWRHRVGDQHHHRFWGQLARSAAQNKSTSGNEFVRFSLESTDVTSGQDVVFRARWTPHLLTRRPDVKAKVQVFPKDNAKPDDPLATVDLTLDPTRPALHQGRWLAPTSGEYRAVLKIDGPPLNPQDKDKDKEIAAEFLVRGPLTKELADVTANRSLLDQMAQASGGRLLLPHQLSELPKLIKPEDLTTSEAHEYTLWDHWMLLVILGGLLTGEWVLRKWNGLP